jgi:hypothetical protein
MNKRPPTSRRFTVGPDPQAWLGRMLTRGSLTQWRRSPAAVCLNDVDRADKPPDLRLTACHAGSVPNREVAHACPGNRP